MRVLFFFGLFAGMISSCGSSSDISKQLSGSDSLVINFNTPQTNTIAKTVTTTENKAIEKLVRFVDGKAGKEFNCSYDGNLMFYKKGMLAGDVSFSFSVDSCQHFMMLNKSDERLTSTIMNNEAADFLKSLSEGKDWY